ncbi:nitrate regulatory protein [Nissabacter sp. SGAir0207]|uniref:nitrate regulatory protein n=1 Tax=Nissabacter sp. SGAir0207 TaxID=2126321 RepID=UPI0010CCF392|nr:nitrate regulatory protein [Nissabacter sp. SGAir0207]QCR37831.1 transcription antitermination regulator [Nissabacter sp. SGAir0207]
MTPTPARLRAQDFILASKQSEIAGLRQLLHTGTLVAAVSALVHALQRERGLSNIHLSNPASPAAAQLPARILAADRALEAIHPPLARLDRAHPQAGNLSRLFNRVAGALHGLEGLPALREAVAAQRLAPSAALQRYSDIIARLLGVVFEAADGCGNPAISKALIALFGLMQGKELAGQERALGAAGFAAGQLEAAAQQQLIDLIDGQERCLQTFLAFADRAALASWQAGPGQGNPAFERLRRALCTGRGPLPPETAQPWFEIATARIDAMKSVEEGLAEALTAGCRQALAEAEQMLARQHLSLAPLAAGGYALLLPAGDGEARYQADGVSPPLGRAILEVIQEQAQHLQRLSAELATLRTTLDERRQVERAKALLMQHRGLSEPAAHKALRDLAMAQNKKLVEIAQALLAVGDMLAPPG